MTSACTRRYGKHLVECGLLLLLTLARVAGQDLLVNATLSDELLQNVTDDVTDAPLSTTPAIFDDVSSSKVAATKGTSPLPQDRQRRTPIPRWSVSYPSGEESSASSLGVAVVMSLERQTSPPPPPTTTTTTPTPIAANITDEEETTVNATVSVSSVVLSVSEVYLEEQDVGDWTPVKVDAITVSNATFPPDADPPGGIYPDDIATGEYDSYENDDFSLDYRVEKIPRPPPPLPPTLPPPPPTTPRHRVNISSVDLHDRDVFDSIMYIYFGDSVVGATANGAAIEAAGRAVLGVASVLALVAQILTLVAAACLARADKLEPTLLLFNIVMALLAGNIVFTFGVQATSEPETCEAVALVLHYLDLVTSFWLLSHGIHIYLTLRQHTKRHIRDYCILSWAIPLVFVVVSYLVNPQGYETHRYCWMSIERGMLLSFIVPVFILILVNTTLIVLGLKHLFALRSYTRKTEVAGLRMSLRAGAILLPLFVVCWFFGVIALESSTSTIVFHLVFAATYVILNWLIFIFFCLLNKDFRQLVSRRICFCWRRSSGHDASDRRRWLLGDRQRHHQHPQLHQQLCDAEPLLVTSDDWSSDEKCPVAVLPPSTTSCSLCVVPATPPPPPPVPTSWQTPGRLDDVCEMRMGSISTISA